MSSKGPGSDIGIRYATAFLALAVDKAAFDQVAHDVAILDGLLKQNGDFTRMTRASILARAEQRRAVLAIAEKLKFSSLTRRFLGVLANNRRLADLENILGAVREEISARRGEITAQITSAHPLTATQVGAMEAALKKGLGKTVKLDLKQDKHLLGGITVKVGSKMIDHSVRARLSRLHRALKDPENANNKSLMREVA